MIVLFGNSIFEINVYIVFDGLFLLSKLMAHSHMEVWSEENWLLTVRTYKISISFHMSGKWFGSEVEKLRTDWHEPAQFQSLRFTPVQVVS
jgi:hypothetical protein